MNHQEGRAWITSFTEAAGCLYVEQRDPPSVRAESGLVALSPHFTEGKLRPQKTEAGLKKLNRMVAEEGTESRNSGDGKRTGSEPQVPHL